MSAPARAIIRVTGLVQGVGFRPFVYRLATALNLRGYVANLGDASVEVVVEGTREHIEEFLRRLHLDKPAPARIESISTKWAEHLGDFSEFRILPSDARVEHSGSTVPPDLAICDECVKDIMSHDPRWAEYPFTCCATCGPRFTMILDMPYDRERTSMAEFPLCLCCSRDYHDPGNRRYHAEGLCCSLCGPRLELLDGAGSKIPCEKPINEAARLIREGYIIAVKGIGGFHVACLATDDEVVAKLRKRRRRPQQPFAVMVPNLEAASMIAYITSEEEKLLTSKERPIVVLKVKEKSPLSKLVSPGLNTVGVMLPYTGIHLLLLKKVGEPALIMTSGNLPGEPMATDNSEALTRLWGVADYFLRHNREIVNRCDDSVVRMVNGVPTFLRRSRGYAPSPVSFTGVGDGDWCVVAFGGDLNVTLSILKGNKCYLSQHIGDIDNLDSLRFLEQSYGTLKRLLKVREVNAFACDLNPSFPSFRLAKDLSEASGKPLIRVQHHHAHAASLAAEHGLRIDDDTIFITIDGVGLGDDGSAWGGEILLASGMKYERVGHIRPYPLPGGDICAYYPARSLAGLLSLVLSQDELESLLVERYANAFKHGLQEVPVILKQLSSGLNVLKSSSTGRFLDAVSALLGLCTYRSYEGEPAMKLEAHAQASNNVVNIDVSISYMGRRAIIDASQILLQLLELAKTCNSATVARTALFAIAKGFAEVACTKAMEEGVKVMGISGGAAVNEVMVKTIEEEASKHGIKVLRHRELPPGDGGLSAGQAFVGLAYINA
ncbi:MAG: carbamoyltransferase HypF [Candidatus Nezhaarchaeota archaeon]|nr:carbamoyltransferase HypF [Candidatus Nezhaarchaeota archaeon]